MNVPINTIYQHDPNIVTRLIAGELILVPIRNQVADMEFIYTLNETGSRIWELLDGQHSLAEIHQQMVDEYEIDPAQAEQDLQDLVESLLEQDALVKV